MAGITPSVIFMIFLSIAAQVGGIFLMPLTKGLTQPLPTLAAAIAFLFGIGMMARISHGGVSLGLLVPWIAASVPLGAIAVGMLAYGEAVSLAKIGTLVFACILIGVANIL